MCYFAYLEILYNNNYRCPPLMPPSYREGHIQALFLVMSGFIRVLDTTILL